MTYDEELADRLRLMLGSRGVTEKKMFGGLAFLLGGNMGGRGPMKGWLQVRAEVLDDDVVLRDWVERGFAYASGLPPK